MPTVEKFRRISVGIDNGILGAISVVGDDLELVQWWDTPIVNLGKKGKTKNEFATAEMGKIIKHILAGKLIQYDHAMVWLEQAHAMPKQGLSSTFKTGRGFGLWEGICIGIGIRYDIVHARRWTKEMLKDVPMGDPKTRSMLKCQRLFPEIPLMKPRGRVLSMDGRADATLIACYGMIQMQGKEAPDDRPKRTRKTPPPERS